MRRRMLLVRLLEGTGTGTLVGALVSLALVGLLYWRGSSHLLPVVATCMALSGAVGFARAWKKRPTLLHAALQIDRQLGLNDLVGTALGVRSIARDSWEQSIIAQADARCAALTPRQLLLHRLGGPAWGAIGLVGTLSLTLAFLAGSATQMRAEETLRQTLSLRDATDAAPPRPLLTLSTDSSFRRSAAPAEGEDLAQENQLSAAEVPGSRGAPASAVPKKQAAPEESDTGAYQGDSTGSGSARSPAEQRHASSPPESAQASGSHQSKDASALAGTGGGYAAIAAIDGNDHPTASPAGAAPHPAPSVAPWTSDRWPDEVAAVRHELHSDRFSPAYHDIVRDYFSPHP